MKNKEAVSLGKRGGVKMSQKFKAIICMKGNIEGKLKGAYGRKGIIEIICFGLASQDVEGFYIYKSGSKKDKFAEEVTKHAEI